jgi:hypothetical protein
MMDGATGAELLLLPETNPAHPELTIARSTAEEAKAQRIIVCLFHELFSGARLVCSEVEQSTGGYMV